MFLFVGLGYEYVVKELFGGELRDKLGKIGERVLGILGLRWCNGSGV